MRKAGRSWRGDLSALLLGTAVGQEKIRGRRRVKETLEWTARKKAKEEGAGERRHACKLKVGQTDWQEMQTW